MVDYPNGSKFGHRTNQMAELEVPDCTRCGCEGMVLITLDREREIAVWKCPECGYVVVDLDPWEEDA